MKSFILPVLILVFLSISYKSNAQDTLGIFINAGYISSIITPDGCIKPDAGGSARIGILTKGKLGFYACYAWFNEYHEEYVEYDDKGSLFIAGIDYRLTKKGNFRGYINLGMGIERYVSTYRHSSMTDIETSVKPDIGLLLNFFLFMRDLNGIYICFNLNDFTSPGLIKT